MKLRFGLSARRGFGFAIALAAIGAILYSQSHSAVLAPSRMARIGTVDDRFQSYNVEMLEVTGGRFWKPYKDVKAASPARAQPQTKGGTPAGISPDLFQYRQPTDLSNVRLRKLAAALGPTFVRVSGTWANTTYFQDSDGPAMTKPPDGFNGVLTRAEWKSVVDFSRAVNARLITSFATSQGARDAEGVWTPDQARHFLAYTKSIGGDIAAAEFMNEPTFAAIGGAPKGYDASAYARDIAVFRPFLRQTAPEILFLGPGSVGEGGAFPIPPNMGFLHSEDLLKATGPVYDIFSYHIYPAVSERCAAGMGSAAGTAEAAALSNEWLGRIDNLNAFYAGLRDRFEPGKPLWLTETADAGCGGNPWASTFLDTFRYVDSHARLAQKSVRVIAHNTLASSDYGLLDETTFAPRPNYWAALLWRKLMGTTVLEPGASTASTVHVYAHCLRDVPGGVALVAINTDRSAANAVNVAAPSERYTLTAKNLEDRRLELNGKPLELGADESLPQLTGVSTRSGQVALPPASITFLSIASANNASCR